MAHRVLIGGLFHETHSFLDEPAREDEFEFLEGEAMIEKRGMGSPMDGALQVAAERGWHVVPAGDARAMPSGVVPRKVLERFWTGLAAAAEGGGPIDAVLLILHGAMVCDGIDDVEGDLLGRLRALPATADVPVFAVLDLHANVTPLMASAANCLVAYRRNPHTDAFDTGRRTAELLDRALRSGRRPAMAYARPPLIWSPSATDTARDPLRTLLERAAELERAEPTIWVANVTGGFSFADCTETGPAVFVAGEDAAVARRAAEQLAGAAWHLRDSMTDEFISVAEARERLHSFADGLNVVVEPSDNIGAGSPGDCTGVLRLLLEFRDRPSAVALWDPAAVNKLAALALGDEVELEIGGRGSRFDAGPVCLRVALESRSNGHFTLEDRQSHLASMSGINFEMGPSAVVSTGQVRLLLTSRRTPPLDLAQWRSQGIDPEKLWAIGVKAAVAHRRVYDPIARRSLYVDTPGPCSRDLGSFQFRHLRRPVYPLDRIDPANPPLLIRSP